MVLLTAADVLPGFEAPNLAPAAHSEAGGGGGGGLQRARVGGCPAPLHRPGLDPCLCPLPAPLAARVPLSAQPERNTVV